MNLNRILRKVIPRDRRKVLVYAFFAVLIGYMACPLSIYLDPVDWWTTYPMIFYADDYTTDMYKLHADFAENVYLTDQGLAGSGTGQLYGSLIYNFETVWVMEKGTLGVIAESASETCAIDVYVDDEKAGSFNGSKQILFCTEDYLPETDTEGQWAIVKDPHNVKVKLVFYSQDPDGVKDLILKMLEFSAKVHGQGTDDEPVYGNLNGHVYDAETNSPVYEAVVTVGDYQTKTNSSGYYEIRNIIPATYLVFCTKTRYEDAESGVTVHECPKGDFCNTLDIRLSLTDAPPSSTAILEGYITSSETGNPVKGATVSLQIENWPDTVTKTTTDSQGYYMLTAPPNIYDFLCLAKNCAPHHSWHFQIKGEMRYDVQMGPGVSYPIPPGRGYNPESETGYSYTPPSPSEYSDDTGTYTSTYPVYVPPSPPEKAPCNYPLQGPIYSNPVQSAPVDGADYVPPPPGYRNSNGLQGAGVTAPPQNAIDQAIQGWQYLYKRAQSWFREVWE